MLDLHFLPATELPDLLGNWIGPVEYETVEGGYEVLCCVNGRFNSGTVRMDTDRVRLASLRPESLDHVARVMARGLRCPRYKGDGFGGTLDPCPASCPDCHGTGYLRKPSPIYHLTDAARTNALPPLVIAQAVGWSVRSVARGGEVLRGVLSDYREEELIGPRGARVMYQTRSRATIMRNHPFRIASVGPDGWHVDTTLPPERGGSSPVTFAHGPETGKAGRAAADRAALAHNFATLDPSGATFPELT